MFLFKLIISECVCQYVAHYLLLVRLKMTLWAWPCMTDRKEGNMNSNEVNCSI